MPFLILFLFLSVSHAADKFGEVCVIKVSDDSTHTIQIDDLNEVNVSNKASGTFSKLSLEKDHVVKIKHHGKILSSFRFTFQKRSPHLKLWYNELHTSWSLSDVKNCTEAKQMKKPLVDLVYPIPGKYIQIIQKAMPEFEKRNLDLKLYRVSVTEDNGTTDGKPNAWYAVTFIDINAPLKRTPGNPGKIPGLEVTLDQKDLHIIKAGFIK